MRILVEKTSTKQRINPCNLCFLFMGAVILDRWAFVSYVSSFEDKNASQMPFEGVFNMFRGCVGYYAYLCINIHYVTNDK